MTDQQQQTGPAPAPLEMARAWAGRVAAIAQHYEQREIAEPGFGAIEAHIHGAGKLQFEAAEMAAHMALVSIAEDLHRLAELLGVVPTPRDAPGQEGKVQGP